MNKLFYYCILLLIATLNPRTSNAQTKKVVLQAFWWDYENDNYPNGWANYLTELAPRISAMGIDAVWIPPSIKNQNFGSPGVGYAPFDHYDLGDKFQKTSVNTRLGTKDELLRMIAVMHANGIEVIQDIVPNHVIGAGSDTGAGGEDPNAPGDLYKNFRYTSYETPSTDQSSGDYLGRSGRFPKNHQNFHPNPGHNCTGGDICSAFFGPDVCYTENAFGQSSNATYNPVQTANYMRNHTRQWLVWYKKQTGFDGIRIDAVKHFDFAAAEDYLYNLQNLAGFASGGNEMFAVGEFVGGTSDVDNWYSAVQGRAGVFDFNLRAFDSNGGLYSMVYGFGNFNMASLPGAQQTEANRINGSIHRTVPFVNNHDTFRPNLDSDGNYNGWNGGSELSPHIEPNEARLPTAYAVIMAMDGNPQIFFEDLFNIGYNSNRFSHDPKSSTSLPENDDIINLVKCHQKLDFKGGAYKVRSAESGLFVVTGSTSDHLVIERSGKAVIGINDNWDTEQSVYIDTDFPQGTVLMDYSGANGLTSYTVPADQRVNIITPAVNPALNSAGRNGYSVWAPVPGNIAFASLEDMYAHLDTYSLGEKETTQEWEMANDLGDSHCSSLMQGGALPANSTNQRIVGKIFSDQNKTVTYKCFHTTGNVLITFSDLDNKTIKIDTLANGESGSFTPMTSGWITVKIRQELNTTAEQKCYVNLTYTAPKVVNTSNTPASLRKAIWSGNANSNDVSECRNWEEGLMPNQDIDVIIPSHASPPPHFNGSNMAKSVTLEAGAQMYVNGILQVKN